MNNTFHIKINPHFSLSPMAINKVDTNNVRPALKSTAAWNAMDKNQGKLH